MMEKKLLLKNIPNSRPECNIHTQFKCKIAKLDTKTARENILSGAAQPYKAHIG